MNGNRNFTLDYIRVIALLGVVTDHYFQIFGYPYTVVGLWMGGVSVTVFFALSAYLFGEKWKKQQYESFELIPFLKKRIIRIYVPMWLVILAIIPIEYYCIRQFDLPTIMFNLLGLCWLKPFGTGGHLWYITMMMALYMAFVLFSRLRMDRFPLWGWLLVLLGIVLLYGLFPQYFMTYSHAGPLLFLWVAGVIFYRGKDVVMLVMEHKVVSLIVFTTLTIYSLLLYLLVPDWHNTYKPWATITTCLVGFMAFVVILAISNPQKEHHVIRHFADISYEYYLVHLPLLPVVVLWVRNKLVALFVLFGISWCMARLLKNATKMIFQKN